MQFVAQAWLVLKLTNSAFLVGLVSGLGTIPFLVFALAGGVIVDRFHKKNVLIVTQSISMLLAFILGLLTIANSVTVVQIAILSFLLGVINAIDTPARQSYVVEMVGKEDLHSAIALNSGIFNSARIVGPAVSGFVISLTGIGFAFILNAFSFIAVIIALFFITTEKYMNNQTLQHPFESLKEGLKFSFSEPLLKTIFPFIAITSIFGWSYVTIMPVIVQDVFKQGADSLGYFYSASGIGALLAVLVVSKYFKKEQYLNFILSGSLLFSLSILAFSFVENYLAALFLLFFSGIGIITQFATINSIIQLTVPDSIRGRVMSVYALMFMGMMPFGSFQVGALAHYFGPQVSIRIGSIVILVYLVFFKKDRSVRV